MAISRTSSIHQTASGASSSKHPSRAPTRPLSPIDDLSVVTNDNINVLLNAYNNLKSSTTSRNPSKISPSADIPATPLPITTRTTTSTINPPTLTTKSSFPNHTRARSNSSGAILNLSSKSRNYSTISSPTNTRIRAASCIVPSSPVINSRQSTFHNNNNKPPFVVGIPNDNHHHPAQIPQNKAIPTTTAATTRSQSSSVNASPLFSRVSNFGSNNLSLEASYGGSGCTRHQTTSHHNNNNNVFANHSTATFTKPTSTASRQPSTQTASTAMSSTTKNSMALQNQTTIALHDNSRINNNNSSNIQDLVNPLLNEINNVLNQLKNPKERPPTLSSQIPILISCQKTIQDLSHLLSSYQLSLSTTQTDLTLSLSRENKLVDQIQSKNLTHHQDYVKLANFKNKAEEKFNLLKQHYKKKIRKLELELFSERLKNVVVKKKKNLDDDDHEIRNLLPTSSLNTHSQTLLMMQKEFSNTKQELEKIIKKAQGMKKIVESRPSSPVASYLYY